MEWGWYHPFDYQLPAPFAVGTLSLAFHGDRLAAVFLILLSVVASCCAIYTPQYVEHYRSTIDGKLFWTGLFLFVSAMAGCLLASQAVTFIITWEVMSLASAGLVASAFRQKDSLRAIATYLIATRIATAFLCAGFLVMFSQSGSWLFRDWHFETPVSWAGATLILIGLCIKSGVWPFHIWLPYAYTQAPSPVSALMSGVMAKIPVYLGLRLFVLGTLTCPAIEYALFGIACISAFGGILFAINQMELKRLLAYSSVENISLIYVAFATCLLARNAGQSPVADLAFAAVLLHCLAHGLIKSLLFLCAGSVDFAAHTRDFTRLGALMHRMPWTGGLFLLGCASICALPPFNGFGSKWYIYQSLFASIWRDSNLIDQGISLAAIGALSACGALAIGCFAKAVGVAFLGKARSKEVALAREVPASMVAGQCGLGAACLVMGFIMPPLASNLSLSALTSGAPSIDCCTIQFAQIAISLSLLVAFFYTHLRTRTPTFYITWDCGFGLSDTKSQVTAGSFAQPIARIFTPILQHHLEIEISGRDRRHFPENIRINPSMVSLLETRIYGPAGKVLELISKSLARLQAGSIHLYLTYLCIALAFLLCWGTQL